MLSARNKSKRPCAFDGYPELRVWIGKAEEVTSEPMKKAERVRLELKPGRTADFPLIYQTNKLPHEYCNIPDDGNADSMVAVPQPAGKDYGSFVHVTDPKGRRLPTQVCNDTIRVEAPRVR